MKTIRIGNDIVIDWAIVRNGRPEDFRAKTLSLFICSRYGKESVKSFAVNGNSLRFSFLGKCQRYTGDYGLLLIVNDGSGGMFSVDLDRAFCLTQHSDCGCDGVIEQMSDIALPANGLSAYELAVINGYEGTEQEWLESLVQPAKDAAAEALAAAGCADSATETAIATNTAVQQAERLRVASEQERVSAESQRTKAEQVRTTAESDRYKAEQARVTAESQRAKAESQRGTAESARVSAETGRTNAETERELSETEREQAEDTRIASEQTRTTAESSRVKSEDARQTAESARQKAETKRQQDTATAIKNAETATTEANNAAIKADTAAENAVLKIAQELTPEEQTQVQTNVGVKDTIDAVGVGEVRFIDVNAYKEGNGYWNKSGVIAEASSTNYFHTKPIPVSQGDIILLKDSFATAAVMPVVKVQSNNTFISVIASGDSSISNYSAIAQAGYISLSVSKSYASRMQALIIPCRLASFLAEPAGGYCHSLYEAAGAVYDAASGMWELNGLDLSEKEMAKVYTFGNLANSNGSNWVNRLCGYNGKTTIPYNQQLGLLLNSSLNFDGAFAFCSKLEVLKIMATETYIAFAHSVNHLFYNSTKLRKVLSIIDLQKCNAAQSFAKNATALEDVKLRNVKISLSFSDSPMLNNESILYLITNAENKSITITLHPDAYDRAMSDSGITSALATKPLITLAK